LSVDTAKLVLSLCLPITVKNTTLLYLIFNNFFNITRKYFPKKLKTIKRQQIKVLAVPKKPHAHISLMWAYCASSLSGTNRKPCDQANRASQDSLLVAK